MDEGRRKDSKVDGAKDAHYKDCEGVETNTCCYTSQSVSPWRFARYARLEKRAFVLNQRLASAGRFFWRNGQQPIHVTCSK